MLANPLSRDGACPPSVCPLRVVGRMGASPIPTEELQKRSGHMSVVEWQKVCDYTDIIFEKAEGIGKITINRPEVRNAFRPETLTELIDAFNRCREDQEIGVIIFTGQGDKAFCSGGDQRVRGEGGYVGSDGVPRLNALDLQKVIKYIPKPVIAMVAGYAIGGGHVLHLLCDLTIAADNARFGQTGPRVGSFDAGWRARFWRKARLLSASLRHPSTPIPMAWPVSRIWRATRPCSIT